MINRIVPKKTATAEPLIRLRKKLTLLCTALTGAVLLAMALSALSLAEGQLQISADATFQSNINAIVAKLQSDQVVSTTWLAQTEADNRLIISITDEGTPLQFPGAWEPDTKRSLLISRAAKTSRTMGVDASTPPLSIIETTTTTFFQVDGDNGDHYMAAVVLIPVRSNWQSLILLKDLSATNSQLWLIRWAFAGLVFLGVSALFFLCWIFAGRAILPIQDSQRRQAEFIAAASHELRSPITVIQTSASAIMVAPEEAERLLDCIESECKRMARLVNDLLSLARSDADTWSIQRETVDTDTLLLETAESFYPLAHKKSHTLLLEVPDDSLPPVQGDSQRLRQILTILLDNAFSYTPAGGTITLAGRAEGRRLLLTVSDTGPGIAPSDVSRIFDRFYRADTARGDKNHFGLGLSIANELSRLHGGSLRISKTGPNGTTFELSLPSVSIRSEESSNVFRGK